MKALLLEKYLQLIYTDVQTPHPGPDEVMIQVKACGICGSDIHGMDGSSGRRIPPLVMGHEAAGVISALGDQVTEWQVGDRVTFDSTIYCGECFYCRRGEVNLCDNRRVLGVSCADYKQDGAFAEYIIVPRRILYRLPEEVSFIQAAMVEPLSVAVHAVHRTPISLNDSAVVVGAGMIGLLVIQALRLAGCGQIIAVDLDEGRLELAQTLGADYGLPGNPQDDLIRKIQALTGGRGADVAFEVVGSPPSFQTALQSLRKGGVLTLIGNLAPKVDLLLQSGGHPPVNPLWFLCL